MLAVVVTLGLLAFAPLGSGLATQGVAAALATAGIGGLVFALARRSGMPVSGPSSATAPTRDDGPGTGTMVRYRTASTRPVTRRC